MTRDYVRTTDAPDSATAQAVVTALARADGLVVRTVKSVRLEEPPNQLRPELTLPSIPEAPSLPLWSAVPA